MNKLRKNLILVLIVSLILSVNYAAFAESSESKDFSRNMDEVTEEKTTDTIATNDATEQEENKDESKEEVITVDETTEKDQEDQSETIDVSEIELEEETELEIEQEEIENSAKDKETKETTQKSDIKEKDEKAANDKDDLQENINKETQDTEKVESKNTQKLDGHEEVATWSEFKAAYESEDVKTITLLNDIKMKTSETSLDTRRTSLTILGKGKTLDTDIGTISTLFSLGYSSSAPEAQTFKIDDLIIKHSNSGQIFSNHNISGANWNLDLSNIRNKETKPALSFGDKIKEIKLSGEKFNWESDTYFIKAINANIIIDLGNRMSEDSNKIISNNKTIQAKNLSIKNSNLKIHNMNNSNDITLLHLKDNSKKEQIKFNVTNSNVEMISANETSTRNGTAVILGNDDINVVEDIVVQINKSDLMINSSSNDSSRASAVLDFRQKGVISIEEGSNVTLDAYDAGIVLLMRGGNATEIKVDGELSRLELKQSNEKKQNRLPVVLYSESGGYSHMINSKNGGRLNIISAEIGTEPTVVLSGGNNIIKAEDGGKIKIINPSKYINKDVENYNQAITINAGKNTEANTLTSEGEGSQFEIISENGKAIQDDLNSYLNPTRPSRILEIKIENQAQFIVKGHPNKVQNNISKFVNGMISAEQINVTIDNPLFYNFMSTSDEQGSIFNANRSKESRFISSDTGLSVWEVGSDISGVPDKHWNQINFELKGINFEDISKDDPANEASKSLSDYFGTLSQSGLDNFSRISNYQDSLEIEADDLFISKNAFNKITNENELKEAMKARSNINNVAITTDIGTLDFNNPIFSHAYNITFSIKDYDEIKVTRKLVILDYDHVTQTKEYVVVANDFSLWEYQAESLSDTEIIERANAIGWQKDTWPDHKVPLSVSTHNVVPIAKKDPYFAKIIIKNLF